MEGVLPRMPLLGKDCVICTLLVKCGSELDVTSLSETQWASLRDCLLAMLVGISLSLKDELEGVWSATAHAGFRDLCAAASIAIPADMASGGDRSNIGGECCSKVTMARRSGMVGLSAGFVAWHDCTRLRQSWEM